MRLYPPPPRLCAVNVSIGPRQPEWVEARAIAFRLISARIGAERTGRDIPHGLELVLTTSWIQRSDNPVQAAVNLIDVLTTICWLIVTSAFDEEDVPDLDEDVPDLPEPSSPEDLLNLIDRVLERITTGG